MQFSIVREAGGFDSSFLSNFQSIEKGMSKNYGIAESRELIVAQFDFGDFPLIINTVQSDAIIFERKENALAVDLIS
jgi:hypothetical protein